MPPAKSSSDPLTPVAPAAPAKKKPLMPQAAGSNVLWATTENHEITRQEGVNDPVVIATLSDSGAVEYVSQDYRKRYGQQLVQFLTDENLPFNSQAVTVKGTEGAEKVEDENSPEYNKKVGKPPRRTLEQGDKTPAYVDWMAKNKPNTYKQLYGIIGPGKVKKTRERRDPSTGRPVTEEYEVDAILATRKTHLTELAVAGVDLGEDEQVPMAPAN